MKETISLDGTWQVIFDLDNEGRSLNLQHRENFENYSDIEEVSVPACLEEFRLDYEGVAWYGKPFTLPEDWQGKTVRLHFDAVNYRAEAWVNGEAADAHEGGYIGFEFQIDDLLNEGENFIAVRVITPLITREVVIDGLGQDDMPHWRGAIAGGIWQSVSLIATGPVFIDDTFVTTDIHTGEVTINSVFQNQDLRIQSVGVEWVISESEGGKQVVSASATISINPGSHRHKIVATVKEHKLWQVDDPNLYVLTTRLTLHAEISDQEETRFGFREFTAEGKSFYLNGEKIILKTLFNEGFYPHSLAYPRDLELLKKEFELVKEGNINMIRPWRKPQPKIVYDLADEMGVLMVGALPVECMDNWPQITPYTKQRIENEATEMVRRDRNHPSIVMWEMFNEICRHGLKRLKHSVTLKARELDPTRMIIDESGGYADGCSVYLPGSYEPITINDVHNYPGMPMPQENYDNFLTLGKKEEQLEQMGLKSRKFSGSKVEPGLLTNISELGYGSIPDLEANFEQYQKEGNPLTPDYRMHERLLRSYLSAFHESGTDGVFPSFRAFVEACQEIHYTGNKLMTEACRINPDIAGIGIHAFNDGDWVLGAGIIDNFRNPKRPYYAIKEVFNDRYVAIRPSEQSVYAGESVQISMTSVNDKEALSGTLSLRVTASDGQALLDVNESITMPSGITDLESCELRTDAAEGPCRIELTFESADASIRNETSIYVLDRSKSALPETPVALVDMNGALGRLLSQSTAFSSQTPADQLVLVNLNGWNGESDVRFKELAQWVEQGGTALFLNLPPLQFLKPIGRQQFARRLVEKDTVLPFELSLFATKGLWTPCSHVVKAHPFYDGLPTNCLMGQEYRNVVSRWCIVDPASNWISGNITYDWFAGLKERQNYYGVSEAFHGAELAEFSHGDGEYVLCTHRIVENLGTDPVADRLLSNLIHALT
jgi:beta-galactosidase